MSRVTLKPKTLSMRDWEAAGFRGGDVEQIIPSTFIRRDFLGVADLLYLHPTKGNVAVQVTSRSNVNGHITKLVERAEEVEWLIRCGFAFVIDGWGGKSVQAMDPFPLHYFGGPRGLRRVRVYFEESENLPTFPLRCVG